MAVLCTLYDSSILDDRHGVLLHGSTVVHDRLQNGASIHGNGLNGLVMDTLTEWPRSRSTPNTPGFSLAEQPTASSEREQVREGLSCLRHHFSRKPTLLSPTVVSFETGSRFSGSTKDWNWHPPPHDYRHGQRDAIGLSVSTDAPSDMLLDTRHRPRYDNWPSTLFCFICDIVLF